MKLTPDTENALEGPLGQILDDAPYVLSTLVYNYINLFRIAKGLKAHDEGSFNGFFHNLSTLVDVWIEDHDPQLEDGTVLVKWNQ